MNSIYIESPLSSTFNFSSGVTYLIKLRVPFNTLNPKIINAPLNLLMEYIKLILTLSLRKSHFLYLESK